MIKIFNIEADGIDLKDLTIQDEGFAFGVEMNLGIDGNDGADLFRFTVCDFLGFQKYILNEDADFIKNGICTLNNYNIIFIKKFDIDLLMEKLNYIFDEACQNPRNWKTIAHKLNKYFYWEYENEI